MRPGYTPAVGQLLFRIMRQMVWQLLKLLVIKWISAWFIDPFGHGAVPRKHTLAFWTFRPVGGVIAGSCPFRPFSWNFISVLWIFSHELWDNTHTHTQLLFPITWTECSGCGLWDLALIFCCSQLYVPWAIAETYLWSARVNYPYYAGNGSGVTAGGVFGLQWCLVAWYVSTQCIPKPKPQLLLKDDWFSYWLWSVSVRCIDASSYII